VSFAVDANLLLYASDRDSPFHARAVELLDEIAMSPELAYLFWPVVMGYLRIATHPTVFARPLSHADARANVESLLSLPHVQAVGEDDGFWHRFTEVADDVAPTGNLVPDAHLAALMLANGVRTIWTRDRDFRKFTGIRVHDPFAPAQPSTR
jgi:toxin-antitoxin system PIN domain toxin